MKPILEIINLSKKFNIVGENKAPKTLRDSIMSAFHKTDKKHSDFFALNDVSFNVETGESIGIIGKNGAGKSTLLKILSKITPPTNGKIISRGRIASLLEVGTGFHAELSGRENIFLNGSILGMRKIEIQKNFDAIVDFSGVAKFIDTPLKHYSSGMQLRLAFAVAAFLENEILIIDEVLAVGDSEFQDKCMGKMKDLSKNEGRTVLFVSHSMASMKNLCKRGILLEKGQVTLDDTMNNVIEKYLSSASKTNNKGDIPSNASSINTGICKFTKFLLVNNDENAIDSLMYLSPLDLFMELESSEEIENALIDIRINTMDGIELVHAMNKYSFQDDKIKKGKNKIYCTINNQLQPGKYNFTIGIHLNNGTTLDYVENIMDFSILKVAQGENNNDFIYDFKLGYVRFESKWKIA